MLLEPTLFTDQHFRNTSYFYQIRDKLLDWSHYCNTSYLAETLFLKVRNSKDALFVLAPEEIPTYNPTDRSYHLFFTLFGQLLPNQRERVANLVRRIVGSSLQLQLWGAIYHAKCMDRAAWHYYIDTGKLPTEYPLPGCSWMNDREVARYEGDNSIGAKEERFNRVLKHLRSPSIEEIDFSSVEKVYSPTEIYTSGWYFGKDDYIFDPDHDIFELPLPHELGITDAAPEQSRKTYTLRNNLRQAVIEQDDFAVVNCLFSHPDVQDSITLLRFYAGLCEGEHERYFTYKTLNSIREVVRRGFGKFSAAELVESLGKPGAILPFHPTSLEDVSEAIEKNLLQVQRQRFLELETTPLSLRNIARERLTELLTTGSYSSTLKRIDRLAILIALLGEYAYQESYVLLSCNELYAVETFSKVSNTPFAYSPDTVVAFPGAGSLPLSAIFKHIMTDTAVVLIDTDADALKKAKAFIRWLEIFSVVKEGKIVCADACSSEEYFEDLQGDKKVVNVVELASLLPDYVKYKTIKAISRLPKSAQPEVVCCRTAYAKTLAIYEKTPALPFSFYYNYIGSTTPDKMSEEYQKRFGAIVYYNHQPRLHIFTRKLEQETVQDSDCLANLWQIEASSDPSYAHLTARERKMELGSEKQKVCGLPEDALPSWAVRYRKRYIRHTHKHFHDDLYHMHTHSDDDSHLHSHEHTHEY